MVPFPLRIRQLYKYALFRTFLVSLMRQEERTKRINKTGNRCFVADADTDVRCALWLFPYNGNTFVGTLDD
jgi:hypothetical protein